MRDYYSIGAVFARVNTTDGMVTLASSGETVNPNGGETMKPYGAVAGTGVLLLDR